jgi:invasion protein IalB
MRVAFLVATAALGLTAEITHARADAVDKAFGPWRITCAEPKGEKRTCVLMVGVINNKKEPVFRWVIGPDDTGKGGHSIAITTLTGVLVADGIAVRFDQGQPVRIPYNICMPAFCAAELPFTDSWLKAFRLSKSFSSTIIAANGKEIKYDIGLEQFGQAYDFYASESAKNP